LKSTGTNGSFGPYKSPAGKQIIPTNAFKNVNPDELQVFFVQYETELNASDTLALKEEILCIWRQAVIDADKQNAKIAAISANAFSDNENKLSAIGFTIIFVKDSSGYWVMRRCITPFKKLSD
jgi:hypothetical protein